MHSQDWTLLILGAFLALLGLRNVVVAWRAQAFNKGWGQVRDLSRREEPARFWLAIVSHLVLAGLGVYLVAWKGAAIFASLSAT